MYKTFTLEELVAERERLCKDYEEAEERGDYYIANAADCLLFEADKELMRRGYKFPED